MKKINKLYLMVIKYLFCMAIPFFAAVLHSASWNYVLVAFAELLTIVLLTNLLYQWRPTLSYIFNVVLIAIVNAQFAIFFWGNSFTSMVMINNLGSIEALSGKGVEYVITFILVVIFTLLPVSHIRLSKKIEISAVIGSIVLCILLYMVGFINYSPFYGVYDLIKQYSIQKNIENLASEAGESDVDFYRADVADYISKTDVLVEKPNVILLFTEGLSQNIIEDTRNIMPNLQALQEESVYFENYYNHTFATYMGLSGQLYSGYQKDIYDPNYLVSIQDIFHSYGYQTTFINAEPENKEFTAYLEDFGFDTVVNDVSILDGIPHSLSDKTSYELLMKTAKELDKKEQPFFISMYTFGTHVSLDSVYEKYGDGSDPLLNRFYDLDVQFGRFWDQFKESDLYDNTVIIMTTDHATYHDSDFTASYPNYERASTMQDRVPLMIYHKGVKPQMFDAKGRNSLDLAPTILDYLDMSKENYFLGESLFSPVDNGTVFDTYFESMGVYTNTESGMIQALTIEELSEVPVQIAKYFALKMNEEDIEKTVYIKVTQKENELEVEVLQAEDYTNMNFALWSEVNGQDDLKWHPVEGYNKNYMSFTIDMSGYNDAGVYNLHLYNMDGEESVLLSGVQFTFEP